MPTYRTALHIFNGKNYPIGVILPDNYDPSKKYIAWFFMHGAGEKGDGTTNTLSAVKDFITSCKLEAGANKYGQIIVYSQTQWGTDGWSADYGDAMLDYAKALPIDFKALTGASMGGGGVWSYASYKPTSFNAYVPVCPVFGMTNPKGIAASGSPVKAFHAKDDTPAVPAENTITAVKLINAENPVVPAELILYETGGHYIWNRAYDETSGLYQWAQALRSKLPIPAPSPTPIPILTTTLKAIAEVKNLMPTTATLDGSKSEGKFNWSDWEMVLPDPANHEPVFPGWKKGGSIVNVDHLRPGTDYRFVYRLYVENRTYSTDLNFKTPAITSAVIKEMQIPIGAKTVILKEGNVIEFIF